MNAHPDDHRIKPGYVARGFDGVGAMAFDEIELKPSRAQHGAKTMNPDIEQVLKLAFPGEDSRYFSPMSVGSTASSADDGAAAILQGIKTTTSSPFWDWPDGRIPFAGALSVLLDGRSHMRAIIETTRVEILSFGLVDEGLAWSYGEGDRTLHWWRSTMGAYYREAAARHGTSFSDDTPLIFEWIAVARRL